MPLWLICVFAGMSVSVSIVAVGLAAARAHARTSRSTTVVRRPKGPKLPLEQLFRQAGYQGPVGKLYLFMALIATICVAAGGLLGLSMIVTLGAGLGLAIGLPKLYLSFRRHKRLQAFHGQLPSALELMASGLRAGMGVNSAFEVIGHEMRDPLGSEFSQLVTEMHLGASLEETLDHFIERNPSSDVRLLTQAVLLHKQVGGNLAEVLDTLDHTIRERFWLQREISAATAEQRMSALVLGLLPAFLAMALWMLNRDYLLTLVNTKPGHYLLVVTVILQVVGATMLRRILKVEI